MNYEAKACVLDALVAGPMAVRGMDGKERDFCEEQAIKIILEAFRTHDARENRGSLEQT